MKPSERQFRAALREYVEAAQSFENRGSKEPEEVREIEKWFFAARKRVNKMITQIFEKEPG